MSTPNKYTVHTRLANCENDIAQLRREIADARTHLAGAVQTAVNDAKNVIQDSIRVPRDGKDGMPGQSIVGPKGDTGERGDILYIGPEETEPIIAALRAEIVTQRAKFQALILQALADNEGPHAAIFRRRLEALKREFGL